MITPGADLPEGQQELDTLIAMEGTLCLSAAEFVERFNDTATALWPIGSEPVAVGEGTLLAVPGDDEKMPPVFLHHNRDGDIRAVTIPSVAKLESDDTAREFAEARAETVWRSAITAADPESPGLYVDIVGGRDFSTRSTYTRTDRATFFLVQTDDATVLVIRPPIEP